MPSRHPGCCVVDPSVRSRSRTTTTRTWSRNHRHGRQTADGRRYCLDRVGFVPRLPGRARHSPHKSAVAATPDAKPSARKNTPALTIAGHHGGVYKSGDVLLSHRVPPAVPSALSSLASGFGMEPGVSRSP